MTLAEYRGLKPSPEQGPAEEQESGHPGPAEYATIGAILAVITAIEVAVFYLGLAQVPLVLVLVVLSALKFALVVLWFMHLRFDAKLFSLVFVGCLTLVSILFVVVLATLGGGLW
jgi:cytochrome c oxidase subunit 4